MQRGRKTTEQIFPGQSTKDVSKNPLISIFIKRHRKGARCGSEGCERCCLTSCKDGTTPLHYAANGDAEATKLLLDVGAEVNATDKDGATPLHFAASAGDAEAVALLLEKGAEVNARDKRDSTPLHAAAPVSADAVRLLLDKNAEVNARDKTGATPLRLAVEVGNDEAAELLEERGGVE